MNTRNPLKQLLAVAASALSLAVSTSASAVEPVQFLDLQWLRTGVSADQAGVYFRDRLDPIVRKHGGSIVLVYRSRRR